MAQLDEILIEQAKHLDNLGDFMKKEGTNLTNKEAQEVSVIIKKNASNLRKLAKKVGGKQCQI